MDLKMRPNELIKEINMLPLRKRIYVLEKTIHSLRAKKEKSDMRNAADLLYSDYSNDKELTAFTSIDCEDFYETR
jgi:uncharacterized small protein (DUF1192 family)